MRRLKPLVPGALPPAPAPGRRLPGVVLAVVSIAALVPGVVLAVVSFGVLVAMGSTSSAAGPPLPLMAGTGERAVTGERAGKGERPPPVAAAPVAAAPVAAAPVAAAPVAAAPVAAAPVAAAPVAAAPVAAAPVAAALVEVDAQRRLAVLRSARMAMSEPNEHSAPLRRVEARRPITLGATVLPVVGQRFEDDGARWLRVRLPGRPNGRTGWIRQQATVAAFTRWHIAVDTSERRVTVYRHGSRVREFRAIVGKPATPTPHGRFFVEEAVQLRESDAGAPFALALSARSNVLQEFNGGPGQIAIHGLTNVGGVLGTAASHGCVRLANDAMRWLVVRIGPGTPVTIKA